MAVRDGEAISNCEHFTVDAWDLTSLLQFDLDTKTYFECLFIGLPSGTEKQDLYFRLYNFPA